MSDFSISKKDWNKIINYARARYTAEKDEIGGMALVKQCEDGFRISDPVILKQKTSGGNCILDKDALADYYVEMAMKHGTGVQFMWWHSHGNMGAFWSSTDTNTMDEYENGDWSVFLVVNIKEEYKFRVQIWHPKQMFLDTDLEILGVTPKKIPDNITKEVEEKCSANNTGRTITTNGTQISLIDNVYGDDTYYYNRSYNNLSVIDKVTKYNARSYAIQGIDALNDEYMDGTLPYTHYCKKVTELNKELAEVGSNIQVQILGEGILFHAAQTNYPYQFIEERGATLVNS